MNSLVQSPAPSISTIGSGRFKASLFAITVAGLVVRLYGIGNRGFWADEINVWNSCFSNYFSAGTGPLPPLLHRSFMRLMQNSDSLTFRLPSLLFGTLFIPLMAVLTRSLANERAAIFAAILTALSPSAVFFSQEARPYAVMHVLCALTYWSFLKGYLEGDDRFGLLYFASLVLGFLNHALTSHVAAGLGLFIAIDVARSRFRDRRKMLYLSLTLFSFVGLNWLRYRWHPLDDFGGLYVLPLPAFFRSVLYCLGPVMHRNAGEKRPMFDALSLVYFVGVALGWQAMRRSNPRQAWAFIAVFTVSLSILFVTLGHRAYWWWGRYLSQLLPIYVALAAIGLSTSWFSGWRTFIATALAIGILVPGLRDWKATEVYNRSAPVIRQAEMLARSENMLRGAVVMFSINSDARWDVAAFDMYRTDRLPTFATDVHGNLWRYDDMVWLDRLPKNIPNAHGVDAAVPGGRYALLKTTQAPDFIPDCRGVLHLPSVFRCDPDSPLVEGDSVVPVVYLNRPAKGS